MRALELLNEGHLDAALEEAVQQVKSSPADISLRQAFVELLCVSGDLERADKQAEAITVQHPKDSVVVALLRQLIRAETARSECWERGRVPEFLGEPDTLSRTRLSALLHHRSEEFSEAGELLQQIEESRPVLAGKCNETSFGDFCDLDDFCNGMLEVLSSTGKYFWVPMERVRTMGFEPVRTPRDLVWRQCEISVQDGPDGVVYIPSTYAFTNSLGDREALLGRSTNWVQKGDATIGVGQRIFQASDKEFGIMDLTSVEFHHHTEED